MSALPPSRDVGFRTGVSSSPALKRSEIERRVWTFGLVDRVFARQVRLLPDGRISGYTHDNEAAWDLRDGLVTFLGRDGVPTVQFDHRNDDEHGIVLWGRHRPDARMILTLAETRPAQILAADMSGFRIDRRLPVACPGRRRRNLVLVFGNQDSLHRRWRRDIADAERSWDLCVSFYGPADHYEHVGPAEFSSLQTGVRKCPAAHAAFAVDSPFWAYDRVWFADDDLMTSWRDINRLFHLAAENGLLLAQPALTQDSHVAHAITRQQPGKLLRFTSFVESMAPVFTRDALRLCIPVFQHQRHGYGIDYVWSWLLGAALNRMAIIDRVAVTHTRAQTLEFDPGTVGREEHALLSMYGVRPKIEEYGYLRDTHV